MTSQNPDAALSPEPTTKPAGTSGSTHGPAREIPEHTVMDFPALHARIADCWPDPMAAPPLRWGIIAPGKIARRFATEIPAFTRSRVVAVGSRSQQRADAFAAAYPAAGGEPGQDPQPPRAYGSYAELVADEGVDAVYIASPHSHHHEHALLALRAGKPVLVEKAFTRSAAQAREVFEEASARNLFVMEAMWTRFVPYSYALREIIASGVLGPIRAVRADHSQHLTHVERLMEPDLAGGALLDLNIYCLAFIHDVLGAPPLSGVTASGLLTHTGVDADEVITLDYVGDHPAGPHPLAVATSMLWGRARSEAEIIGDFARADIHGRFYRPTATVVVRDVNDEVLVRFPQNEEIAARAHEGGFQHQAAEVARQIAAGKLESPLMSWRDTLEIMEIADEVRRQLGVVYPGEEPDDR